MIDHTEGREYRHASGAVAIPAALLGLEARLGWAAPHRFAQGGPKIDPRGGTRRCRPRTQRCRVDDASRADRRCLERRLTATTSARGRKLASAGRRGPGPGDVTALSADVARTPHRGHRCPHRHRQLDLRGAGAGSRSRGSPVLAGRPRAVARLPHSVLRPVRAPTMGSGDVDPGQPARGRLGYHGDDVPRP